MDVENTIRQILAVQAETASSLGDVKGYLAELARRQLDADARADRAEARADKADDRADKADARMDKFDKRLEATRRLVEGGIKFVTKLAQTQAADRRDFNARMKAFDERMKAFDERMKVFDDKMNALVEAQMRNEASIKRLVQIMLRHRPNGRGGPNRSA